MLNISTEEEISYGYMFYSTKCLIHICRNWTVEYVISTMVKNDLCRYMVLIDDEDSIYAFDRNNDVFKLSCISFPHKKGLRHIQNTLLDCEMIIEKVCFEVKIFTYCSQTLGCFHNFVTINTRVLNVFVEETMIGARTKHLLNM